MNRVVNKQKYRQLAVWACVSVVCQPTSAQNYDVDQENSVQFETIIVVGEKSSRDLQDTRSSVSVTTSIDIQEKGYYTIQDIYSDTAGVYPDAGGLGFAVRGIPFEGLGGNRSSSDVVTVYIDGVAQTNSSVNFNPIQLWDVEQVEIYRGAQSTVQGRNSLAGAVIINTQKPTYGSTNKARFSTGSYGTVGGSVAFGGAIKEDVAAWRLSVDHLSSDGYIENRVLNNDANKTEFNNLNGKILLEPTDVTQALLIGTYSKSNRGEVANDTANGDAFDFDIYQNIDAYRTNEVSSFAVNIDHTLNDLWALTSITTYNNTQDESLLDWSQTATPRDDILAVDREQDTVTQELRLGFDNQNNLKGRVGLYYYQSKQEGSLDTSLAAADAIDPGIALLYADGFRFTVTTNSEVEIENYAVFGELEWVLNDKFTVIAGARQDYETNDSNNQTDALANTPFNGSPADPLLQGGLAGQAVPFQSTDASYNAFLPKLGVVYSVNDEVSVGFVAQRAYRAGGTTINRATGIQVEYDPEYTDNYEISFRSQWPDAGLIFNSNIYYIDWTDQQVTVFTDQNNLFSGQIENAGESHLSGIELSLEYMINDQWSVYTSSAFNDTQYDDFTSLNLDLSGEVFEGAPETIANVGVSYRHTGGFGADLRTRYQSDSVARYITDQNGVRINRKNDSFTTIDLTLSYTWSSWLFTAQVNNALDEEYITNNQNDSFVDVGAPRTYLVSAQYDF